MWGRGTSCGGKGGKEVADVLETFVQVVVGSAFEIEIVGVHSLGIFCVCDGVGTIDLRKVFDLLVNEK